MPASALRKKILIVEDEPAIRELISAVLRAAGYEVDTAEHALGAVCAVVRAAPDLVVADICMPIVDGLGLASGIKRPQEKRPIPIVALNRFFKPLKPAAALHPGYDG